MNTSFSFKLPLYANWLVPRGKFLNNFCAHPGIYAFNKANKPVNVKVDVSAKMLQESFIKPFLYCSSFLYS